MATLKSFPYRFAFYLVAALYLFADLIVWEGPLHRRLARPWTLAADASSDGAHVATVYGRPITRLQLSEALRDYLWTTGEEWEELGDASRNTLRLLVLEQLVQKRMIHAFRKMNGLDEPVSDDRVAEELQQFERRFASSEDLDTRRSAQLRGAEGIEELIRDQLDDQAWMEEKIAARIGEITEQDAREWFAAHRESLALPPRWRVSHLFLTLHSPEKGTERDEEALGLLAQLKAEPGRWREVVEERSEDERTRYRGGDLGWFSELRMPAALIRVVREIEVGSDPVLVTTPLGWHLVRKWEEKDEEDISFETVREEILVHLRNERRQAAVKSLLAELRQRSLVPTTFLLYHHQVVQSVEPAPVVGKTGD